jgi:hypothetical protein
MAKGDEITVNRVPVLTLWALSSPSALGMTAAQQSRWGGPWRARVPGPWAGGDECLEGANRGGELTPPLLPFRPQRVVLEGHPHP